MLRRRRFALVGLAAVSCLSVVSPAMAQFKDSDGNIHFQNLTPSQKIEYSAGSGLTKKIVANFCGLLVVPVPSSTVPMPGSITVGGASVSISSLPVLSVPSCLNNVLKEPRAANFKDATGRVVLVSRTPGVQAEIVYTGVPATKSLTANGCGYARIGNSVTTPAPASFTYNGTSFTSSALTMRIPNRCIDGKKFVYTP